MIRNTLALMTEFHCFNAIYFSGEEKKVRIGQGTFYELLLLLFKIAIILLELLKSYQKSIE